jgi:AcrR family transcriptional regulator
VSQSITRSQATERKSDRTRRRVLSAAKQLFDRKGFRDTTIDDITRRANIAHGTFYLYFHGKRDLLRELMDQAFAEFDAIVSTQFGLDQIEELLRKALQTYERNRLTMRVLREASATDPFFRENYESLILNMLVTHLSDGITELQRQLPVTLPPEYSRTAARAIVGMIESFAYALYVGGEDYDLDQVVVTLNHFCVRALGVGSRRSLDAG